ncbi:MAG: outer membrane beta-barrel domain-containing protein [Aquabacterium sp.]|uniref:outer membrane beta-barrel domain-containing protein n=1 Tax=Aquabacterium sp. TaxID=1872578 RepID=UPI00120BCBA4|nr:outer membrane beta-barrel domain-containing protein [Aquabacterium sp.]TAK96152.1 MAG: outer membrane beta-barrel domain-containing protein [Aquabacterium sp.]
MFYRTRSIVPSLLALTVCAAHTSTKADEPPIVPQVEPREVTLPHFPSNDFDAGLFMGTYSTQNFGASKVRGFRLGYAITEDFFVQGTYGRTKVSDEAFRQVLPGGVFEEEQEKLTYYNLSIGYNVLAGEVFIGSKHAKPSALYLIGGVGSTKFVDRKRQTINYGAGFRVYLNDWAALQVDARNHIFTLDILGKQQSTNNLEFTAGATFIF